MTRKFCQSTTTGVVLPYNEKLAKRSNVRVIEEKEGIALLLRERARGAMRKKARQEYHQHQIEEADRLAEEEAQRAKGAPGDAVPTKKKRKKKTAKTANGNGKSAEVASDTLPEPASTDPSPGVMVTDFADGEPDVSEIMSGLGME